MPAKKLKRKKKESIYKETLEEKISNLELELEKMKRKTEFLLDLYLLEKMDTK